ncbi:uncharacterized protein LOC135950782 [Calliphora vicina]|uniref:uncharacterized protein LOC135950782 n=1 Tax=Calliphora vicina TaxID=7373 RepID=UPI00325BD819
MIRRVKKTTNEQFDLLKAEMAVHPAAARGYGVGAQRAVVDAEWKDIVDKLNALGPPERTMTEWKKVRSDLRLRIEKQKAKKPKKLKKPKKEPKHVEEDNLMEALNSSISIYGTHIDHSDNEQIEDAIKEEETYEVFEADEEEDHNLIEKTSITYKTYPETPEILQDVEQTVVTVQNQLEKQEQLMDNLLKVSSNIATLMQRHLKAVERKTSIMERQLKLNKYHNVFLRRKEAKKFKKFNNGVWSDLRLRSIKRLSDEFTPKPRKTKYKSKKDKLLETLNSSESIYASYGENTEHKPYLSPSNIHDESHNDADESYDNPLHEDDDLHNTEKHFFKTSNDTCYAINSLQEEEDIYHNNSNSYNSECLSQRDAVHNQLSQDKLNYLGQTLSNIEHQMKNQNKIMEHLTKITSNLAELMERQVMSMEKQNDIMERQLRATKCHNVFLRRQEATRKMRSKSKVSKVMKKS